MTTHLDSHDTKRKPLRRALGKVGRLPTAFAARSRRVRLPILGALTLVALVLASTTGYLSWNSSEANELDHHREDALAAATKRIPQLLSFHAPTLDAEAARAKTNLAGAFADKYTHLLDTVVLPGTRSGNLSTDAKVLRAAVTTATPDQVDVLLFINQSTTSPDRPQPATQASRATAHMTKEGENWLVNGLKPL